MIKRMTAIIFAIAFAASPADGAFELRPAFPSLSFTRPVDLQNAGDGSNRLFVVEKRGRIYVFDNDSTATVTKLFLDIEIPVASGGSEMGLLGLAFHPEYPDTPYFYVNYTAADPRRTVIERYTVSANPDSADSSTHFTIIEVDQPFSSHNAGQLAFGPDGMLYIGMGDGGGGDPLNDAQNLQTLLGAMLRIDVDSTDAGLNYSIPTDNPYVGNTSGYREEIWAHGFRNPWRYSFDYATGWLWLGDVGQSAYEEIDILNKGGNYGWKVMEGFHCYPSPPCDTTLYDLPVWEYAHPGGANRSITGGYVYRGSALPGLAGQYVYADYITGEIWGLDYDGVNPPVNTPLEDAIFNLSSLGVDEGGELFFLNYNAGDIWKLTPVATGIPGGYPPGRQGSLAQSFPNPFNPITTIRFSLERSGFVEIDVYDVNGQPVTRLVDRHHDAGTHTTTWSPEVYVASGVYFYRLRLDGETVDTRRMVFLK